MQALFRMCTDYLPPSELAAFSAAALAAADNAAAPVFNCSDALLIAALARSVAVFAAPVTSAGSCAATAAGNSPTASASCCAAAWATSIAD